MAESFEESEITRCIQYTNKYELVAVRVLVVVTHRVYTGTDVLTVVVIATDFS